MKKTFISALLAIFCMVAVAQNKQLPYSLTHTQTQQNAPETVLSLPKPDVQTLLQDDIAREKQGVFYRTGVMVNPKQEITENSGTWTDNFDGTVTWKVTFKSDDATALGIYFDYFEIPEQGRLFAYNQDRTHIVGPYSTENSMTGDVFATAPVTGSEVTLEYNGPSTGADDFHVRISEVAYMYRSGGFSPKNAGEFGDSDPCQVNANCSEGAAWGPQRRSVVKIIVRDGANTGLCSGAMVNTANEDCTPYVLTANHCGGGATVSNFKQWVFYFNFETPGCTNPASANNLDDQTVTGCLKMANSQDVSDVLISDFMLVHLKNRPASSFNAYMAGWSRSTTPAASGVGIHHPSGDVKKISTYTSSLTNSGWSGSNWGRHWAVIWAATANGHGVTEGGSSGSPIFDQNGRIVGDLSGGSSFCTNTSGQDVYGKFSYSWDQTAGTSNRRLKDWLDKTSLNPMTMNGKDVNSCGASTLPTVDFVADNTTPSVGQTVTLTDQSTGTAAGYEWFITPASHTYVEGTTSLSENPKVQFSGTAAYTVTLHVYNTAGYALKTRTSYIKPHSTASIDETDAQVQPVLFPNPTADGAFQIVGDEAHPIAQIAVTDMEGKTLYTWAGSKVTVNVNDLSLAKGIYFVKIKTGQKVTIEKLVVQ